MELYETFKETGEELGNFRGYYAKFKTMSRTCDLE